MTFAQTGSGPASNRLLHMVLILLLGLLAYSNTFGVPFVFDDIPNIVENPLLKSHGYFTEPSSAEGLRLPRQVDLKWKSRFVGYLTFALNWQAHGLDVRGYHIFNLAVHLANALLTYWLVLLTFGTPFISQPVIARNEVTEQSPPDGIASPMARNDGLKKHARLVALFAGLLFVAHPIQTQAITYIVQRFSSLATLFYLLSAASYARARLSERRAAAFGFYALSLASAVLAMKTKETAFTLPVTIALYEFFFFRGALKRRVLYLVPLLLTMLIIPLAVLGTDGPPGEVIGGVGEATRLETGMSRPDYLFTEFRVITTYIRLLFLPMNQNLDYDYPASHSMADPDVFLSFMLLISIFALGAYLFHRSRKKEPALRAISFGILWFFVALSVESSVIPIQDVMFEHRLYLPSAGAFMALAAGAALAVAGLTDRRVRTAAVFAVAIIALVFGAAAYARNSVWRSGLTLWEDVAAKSPQNVRAHNNLGNAYASRGHYDLAIDHYLKALALKPPAPLSRYYYAEIHYNLAVTYGLSGLPDKAIEHYRASLELKPDNPDAYNNLGLIYFERGMTDKAVEYYKEALRQNPSYANAHFNLGEACFAKGLIEEAIGHYSEFLKYRPDYAEAHYNLAVAYREKGLDDKAEEHFRIAESLRQNR